MKRGSLTVSTNYDLAPANLNANPNFRGVDLSIVNREKKLDLELIGSSLRIQWELIWFWGDPDILDQVLTIDT